jgi:hypothetical protein
MASKLPKIYEDMLISLEANLRFLANKTPEQFFSHDERTEMGEFADKIAQIRIPIHFEKVSNQ